MAGRTGRKKAGRTKKQVDDTREAYKKFLVFIKEQGKRTDLDEGIHQNWMEFLNFAKEGAEKIMMQDHLNG